MTRRVAALYIDPHGVYPTLPNVDVWDLTRDARRYAGPHPVVAHPPCGPWGKLRHLYRGDEHDCAPRAVYQVRAHGGVLEHPAGSQLWAALNLPPPGRRDGHGGRTCEVDQVRFGHVARKRTWLYTVGVPEIGELPPERAPTHWISGGRTPKTRGGAIPPGIKACSLEQRTRTPRAFAEFLIALARSSAWWLT